MSQVLSEIIQARKQKAIKYEEYLKQIVELAKSVNKGTDSQTPETLDTKGKRALYHNLENDLNLAITIHNSVMKAKKDDWRGNLQKENQIKAALFQHLGGEEKVENIFRIIKEQYEY